MDINGYGQMVAEEKRDKLAIFIVDNQPIYRWAVCEMLKEDMDMVGESPLNANICSLIENLSPDVALVDVGLPLFSGFGLARAIATRCPKVAVVMISPSPDDDQLFQAIKSGAVAFLSKDISADGLISTLRKVGQGEYPINESLLDRPNAAKKVLDLFHNLSRMDNDTKGFFSPLSRRETEILKYIAEGNANKRIAAYLNTSEQTIKNYIASIMRKLNANDRTHAVVLALRRGLLNMGEISDPPEWEEEPVMPARTGANRHLHAKRKALHL